MDFPQAAEVATCLLLAWASACDLRTRTIPNACSVGGAVLTGLLGVLGGASFVGLVVSVGAVTAFFGAAVLWRPGSLGAGDAKLAVLVGAALGPGSVLALLLGLALALAWCLGASALSATGSWAGTTVPLAPFMAAGVAVTLALAG